MLSGVKRSRNISLMPIMHIARCFDFALLHSDYALSHWVKEISSKVNIRGKENPNRFLATKIYTRLSPNIYHKTSYPRFEILVMFIFPLNMQIII